MFSLPLVAQDEWMVGVGLEPPSLLASGSISNGEPEWWSMKTIEDLRLPTPLTVSPYLKCAAAIKMMNLHGFDQLPVVDR